MQKVLKLEVTEMGISGLSKTSPHLQLQSESNDCEIDYADATPAPLRCGQCQQEMETQ